MYVILLGLLLAAGAALVVRGIKKASVAQAILGVLVGILTLLFFWFLDFWGELLWFQALGYGQRFWTAWFAKGGFAVLGAAFGWAAVYGLTVRIPREKKLPWVFPSAIAAFIGGVWGLYHWDTLLKYTHRVATDLHEPILGKDTGFYLFTLPFYDALYQLFLLVTLVGLATGVLYGFVTMQGEEIGFRRAAAYGNSGQTRRTTTLYLSGAVLLFVLAWGKYLNSFHLLYSDWGAVSGPGWTDVHVRLPAYTVVALITAALGSVLLIPSVRERINSAAGSRGVERDRIPLVSLGAVGAVTVGIWIVVLGILPALFQWLAVEPNEITYEEPYIGHNITFTRHGFRLHQVEEREFPAKGRFTQQMVTENQNLFSNIRLWDWRALDAVYKQFQEIRLYYEFMDVDIDRYTIDDAYRQVMVSAREMELSNLPQQSQTFVNRRFKYTHGYGITLTTVNEFTPQGLPNLLIKDIPPQSEYPELQVTRPQLYYGELTRTPVVVNTQEEEIDYPRGETNVYIRYPGQGGVQISNLWRKFLFGWKFDGTRFFLSGYPTPESRVMFHREIKERIRTLAPFLHFDDDPYVVLIKGKLYWIVDGYTTSSYYPYSEPFDAGPIQGFRGLREERPSGAPYKGVTDYLDGVNYIRNAVKVVVDAFNGSVDFYVFEPEDPLLRVWQSIFPELFKPREAMPEEFQNHVRYPADMLLTQGLVYAKYHMNEPTVFYNQEDLWVRATEKYYNQVQPVDPYYIMWEPPGRDDLEFVLILPFTPKNRQVLIGWIAGMCDPENYGRFLAYKFPKEKRILGPQQVETKVDQDRFLSGQLTLWDQRGSNVIRGNVLAIPVEETLFYVEPIYLQAETAAYPELRLVIVMYNDILSYGETFDQALQGLFEEGKPAVFPQAEGPAGIQSLAKLVGEASTAFEDYLRYLGGKQFQKASQALKDLQSALEQLSRRQETETAPEGAERGGPREGGGKETGGEDG